MIEESATKDAIRQAHFKGAGAAYLEAASIMSRCGLDDWAMHFAERGESLLSRLETPRSTKSAPLEPASHNSGERLPSSDAATCGADTLEQAIYERISDSSTTDFYNTSDDGVRNLALLAAKAALETLSTDPTVCGLRALSTSCLNPSSLNQSDPTP